MAAMPFGMVVGAFLLSRIAAPSTRVRMMGWLHGYLPPALRPEAAGS
jgi:hypothetical protein